MQIRFLANISKLYTARGLFARSAPRISVLIPGEAASGILKTAPAFNKHFFGNNAAMASAGNVTLSAPLSPWMTITPELSKSGDNSLPYPRTRTGDDVDRYSGGVEVADPYRWLEEDVRTSSEVTEWVKQQQLVTTKFMERLLPLKTKIRTRLGELYNHHRRSALKKRGSRLFFSTNEGLQSHDVWYWAETETGAIEALTAADITSVPGVHVLANPNAWSNDGSISLSGVAISDDASIVALHKNANGSDWMKVQFMQFDRETNAYVDLAEDIGELKYTGVDISLPISPTMATSQLHPGAVYVYYSKFMSVDTAAVHTAKAKDSAVFRRKLRLLADLKAELPAEEDVLLYKEVDYPEAIVSAELTTDQMYLVLDISKGTYGDMIKIKSLTTEAAELTTLFPTFDHKVEFVCNVGRDFYFLTDKDCPNKRLVRMNLDAPTQMVDVVRAPMPDLRNNSENVRGTPHMDTVDRAAWFEKLSVFLVTFRSELSSRIGVYDKDGVFLHEIPLPGNGGATVHDTLLSKGSVIIEFNSPDTPTGHFRYSFLTQRRPETSSPQDLLVESAKGGDGRLANTDSMKHGMEILWQQNIPGIKDVSKLIESRIIQAESKDGTKVPVVVLHKRGIAKDGTAPLLLYGYGGFSISLFPSFSLNALAWVELGGIYAVASIRGGGEFGEQWHKDGRREKKQNCYDDMVASAEMLIREGYASAGRIVLRGGSNGGLMAAAVGLQRPDLFGALLPHVGVLDMMRYNKFTAGVFWVEEYGDPAELTKTLLAYSPYHRALKLDLSRTRLPPMMLLTADTDDRVVPAHSFKFAAALQAKAAAAEAAGNLQNPILLRLECKAGHGGLSSLDKRLDEFSDEAAFALAMVQGPQVIAGTGDGRHMVTE